MAVILATWALVIVAMLAIVYQVLETSRSRTAEALTAFRENWDSQASRARRRRLAAAMLDGNTVENLPPTVVEDVVNFFEDLGMAMHLRHLNKKAVWNSFYDDASHYWTAVGEPYARELREDEVNSQEYREFQQMITELKQIERRRTRTTTISVIDASDVKRFLLAEAGLDQLFRLRSGDLI